MVIACDTSFLFSLYGSDAHSSKAVAWSVKSTKPLLLNSLTCLEFGNAVRFLEFRRAIPLGTAAHYWAGFEAAIAQRRLIVATSNPADVNDEANRLSSTHPLAGGHRGFDILHVASATVMHPVPLLIRWLLALGEEAIAYLPNRTAMRPCRVFNGLLSATPAKSG